jgi:vesicle coat complex subunit
VILAVNLLKKELRGAVTGGNQDVYNAGLAINCLSNIVTEELARDLLPELTNLLSHPQPYLRKKAILVLFKTFVRYPDGTHQWRLVACCFLNSCCSLMDEILLFTLLLLSRFAAHL